MKHLGLTIALVLAVHPGIARADQPAQAPREPVARGDASASLGWFNANKSDLDSYNDWYNRSVYGGATAGWYWTDHHKTEVEFGASSQAEFYASRTEFVDGLQAFRSSRYAFSTRRLSIGQHYQFFRNAWFHPYGGAGLDLIWETIDREDEPVYAYDASDRSSRMIEGHRRIPRHTQRDVKPFGLLGFKAYMTRRGFFRADLKLTFEDGVDEALVRFGFGADF